MKCLEFELQQMKKSSKTNGSDYNRSASKIKNKL